MMKAMHITMSCPEIQEIIKIEKNIADKNIWFNNHWTKTLNLLAVDILDTFVDKKGKKFNEENFLQDQEIAPQINTIQGEIARKYPEWLNVKNQKAKLLKLSKMSLRIVDDLIIFDEKIFGNNTQEGNIIWDEILTQMLYQISGVAHNPTLWLIKNRFWINSKFAASSLGLKLKYANEKVSKKQMHNLVKLEMKTESDTNINPETSSNTSARLPKISEIKKITDNNPSTPVLMALSEIVTTPDQEIVPFVKWATEKLKTKVTYREQSDSFIMQGEEMSSALITEVYGELKSHSNKQKFKFIETLDLDNNKWLELKTIIGGGDTIDSKNILVLWNYLKDKNKPNISITAKNMKGLQTTCNYVVRNKNGKKFVCGNYIGTLDTLCSIHHTINKSAKNEKFENINFPVIFGCYTFYVEAAYENVLIGKKPHTFCLSRRLATQQFEVAIGNKNFN